MRLSRTPPSLLSFLLVALPNIRTAQAFPVGEFDFAALLLGRTTCVSYCGADNQFCCTQGQSCTTLSGNVATCMAGNGAGAVAAATGQGGYAVYTTTYTETDLILRTSTYSSFWQAATSVAAPVSPATTAVAICTTAIGETSCGPICCASDQACAAPNSCTTRGTSWIYVPTASGSYSPPLRPTSGGVSTATGSISATTTQPFIPPATASGSTLPIAQSSSNGGLSGGAIAGIVIGTIAGVILLLLICFCCIVKAGFSGFLALFGLGKDRRRRSSEVEVIEERYSRHGSGTGASRRQHAGWFGGGGRPSRVTEERKHKSSGFGGFGAIGAGLLGLAVILGLKRKADHKEKPSTSSRRSDLSSSYYSYESYTGSSPSSASSDRRSRGTRGTRTTRHSRHP